MKVKELIEYLKSCNEDAEVTVGVDKLQTSPNDRDMNVSAPLKEIIINPVANTVLIKGFK